MVAELKQNIDFKMILNAQESGKEITGFAPLQYLIEKGVDFIAVGALHLPGETGLCKLLRERGWNVQRVFDDPPLDREAFSSSIYVGS